MDRSFPSGPTGRLILPLLDWPYTELTLLDPKKADHDLRVWRRRTADLGSKPDWIRDAFRTMKTPNSPRIRACIFWHERWQNSEGADAANTSNLRVNSTPESLEASIGNRSPILSIFPSRS